jgi:hypothetical protein
MAEKVADFTSLKELIDNQLEDLFESQGVQLPAQLNIQDVAAHLHNDVENVVFLQNISLC